MRWERQGLSASADVIASIARREAAHGSTTSPRLAACPLSGDQERVRAPVNVSNLILAPVGRFSDLWGRHSVLTPFARGDISVAVSDTMGCCGRNMVSVLFGEDTSVGCQHCGYVETVISFSPLREGDTSVG
jgi:hypothetical protein